jgi:lipoprotein-anchoring transpeptidase ErfK/SrfK
VLIAPRSRLAVTPKRLGAIAQVPPGRGARAGGTAGTAVKLRVKLNRPRTLAYLKVVATGSTARLPMRQLALRGLRPSCDQGTRGPHAPPREGDGGDLHRNRGQRRARRSSSSSPRSEPSVTRASIGPVIVIRRGSNRLYLYDGMRFQRVFRRRHRPVGLPTPLGRWSIVVKWRNPWWYPAQVGLGKGEKPVPPGPGNPLGTLWMGLSASGVGIHGTPDEPRSAIRSHGCIRRLISDAEWPLQPRQYRPGTVFIVSA